MAINQKQIASTLNLSVATISRSLKNDQAISPKTRALVYETARQMGYELQGLQKPGSFSGMKPFCTIIQTDAPQPDMYSSKLTGCMTGISEAAFRMQTSMITHYVPLSHRDYAAEQEFLPVALTSGVAEGIILINYFPDEVVKKLSEQFPCVSISYDYHLPFMDIVTADGIGGVAALLRLLNEHRHRRIAFAGRDIKKYYTHHLRLNGFISGLLELDLDYLPEHVYNLDESETEERLIKAALNKEFSALVCADAEGGYALAEKFIKAGVKIPEDISMVSFDSLPAPEGLPQLVAMKMPMKQIGTAAVSVLKERIADRNALGHRLYLDCIPVDGETVAFAD